ncbi:MAG: hypothetical protein M0P71_13035 [Melioribacteraceae bacterium]|jgi:hypothetical protein|nr:hypothetical protein [Melioribacteraceae bacterium]
MVIEQIISEPQMKVLSSTARNNLFLSGVGAGKTFLGGVISRRFISSFPEARGFVAANSYDQLNTSTLFRIREYWASTGMTEWSRDNPSGVYVSGKEPPPQWIKCKRNFDRFNNIISFCNGALIFTGSLDLAYMHAGKEFSWAILDETKDSREEDIKEVIITRLRQSGIYLVNGELKKEGTIQQQFNPLYILTSPAKVDWINEWFGLEKYIDEIAERIYSETDFFYKEDNERCIVISSTYHNVHNVGENYINNIKLNNTEERAKALIYANPFTQTGGEYYSSFNRLTHVEPCNYDPQKPIHITFDQNSVPYNSASIWQFEQKDNIWWSYCIDEIALENPRNSTEEVCEEFMMHYPNHKTGLYYYGDASGKARSTMNKEFKHHYQIVEYKLRHYLVSGSNRTATHNPLILKRRDFINKIFEDKLPIRIRFDERCKHMINDMMFCKQAVDGTKDKHIVTDRLTGDKYQKWGHMSDNLEYMIVEAFKNYYET